MVDVLDMGDFHMFLILGGGGGGVSGNGVATDLPGPGCALSIFGGKASCAILTHRRRKSPFLRRRKKKKRRENMHQLDHM